MHHIDTSSFAVKRDVAVRIGHAWYGQWGADRQFFTNLKQNFPKFACTNTHSLCYRLDGNPNSVNKEFFDSKVKFLEKWGSKLPLDLKPTEVYVPQIKVKPIMANNINPERLEVK